MNSSLFKKYDVRGKASGKTAELTPDVAEKIGRAFATYLQSVEQKQLVVVGRDNRATSHDLQIHLIGGLRKAGCHVVDIGLVATPVVYWHSVQRDNAGGVMVTGSHLPSDQNGFKFCIGSRTLYGDNIQALRAIIEIPEYFYGGGNLEVDHAAYSKYFRDLEKRIPQTRKLKVVVDAGNGVGGLFAPRLFEFWGHDVVECLYCEPDAGYPNHHPDPSKPENMLDLSRKVCELGADIGIAFDGDSDRMGAVDEQGNVIAADRLVALLAVDMLSRHPGASVVADVVSSQVLFDAVEQAGGSIYMSATGHSLVKEALHRHKALLGGEASGHIFLAEDYFGFDDAFMASGRLLQLVAASGKTLSELDNALPRLYNTPTYRPFCPDEVKQTVIEGVAAKLKDKGEVTSVDGVRIQFENGWGLLRASNTEQALTLRFEGKTKEDALAYRDLFFEALTAYPQVGVLD